MLGLYSLRSDMHLETLLTGKKTRKSQWSQLLLLKIPWRCLCFMTAVIILPLVFEITIRDHKERGSLVITCFGKSRCWRSHSDRKALPWTGYVLLEHVRCGLLSQGILVGCLLFCAWFHLKTLSSHLLVCLMIFLSLSVILGAICNFFNCCLFLCNYLNCILLYNLCKYMQSWN